jgi:Type II secretion system (T2SS), protein E, N-terminal domain
MGAMSLRGQHWSAVWRDFWERLAPRCGYGQCAHAKSTWRKMRRRSGGVRLQGARYCRTECLELALIEVLGQARREPGRATVAAHRIPLGLLLLSRKQLTAPQLRTALEAQRAAGGDAGESRKKIGAWLQELGYATEHQITSALACQWSCPVLRTGPGGLASTCLSCIPALLLESFRMVPVELVEATGILFIAFSEGIDYTVLYAIEQMLGYRTEACLVCPSILQKSLQGRARPRGASDVVIEAVADARECAHIIGSYCAKLKTEEVRFARCGEHLWIRLERFRHETINLVLRVPAGGSQFSVPSSKSSAL